MFNLDSEFLLIPPSSVQFKLQSLPSPIPYFHLHVFYRQTLSPQKTSKLFSFSLLQHIKQFKNFIPYYCEKQICNKSSRLVCSTFFLWSNSIQFLGFCPPLPPCGCVIWKTVQFIYVHINFVSPHSHLFMYYLVGFSFQKISLFLNSGNQSFQALPQQ